MNGMIDGAAKDRATSSGEWRESAESAGATASNHLLSTLSAERYPFISS